MSQLQPSKRSAPHVVFLVDIVQDYTNGQEATARWIQHMILRILLFFLNSIDKRTTWGYRFFSSDTCSIAMSNQSFRSISKTAINAFLDDFTNRIANANNNATSNGTNTQPSIEEAPFTVVNRNLAQTLAEFHWSDIDLASESPRRQQQRNRTHIMDVKNFTYLVTRAPHSLSALRTYLPPEMALDDSLPVLDQAVQGLKKMHAELRKWLWEDYTYHRISLTWVDTASFDSNSKDDADAEETWICNGISSILHPFGGCHINAAILTEEYARFGLSFDAIFNECTQRKVELTADAVTSKPANELVASSKYTGSVWTGTLIPHSDDHPPMQVKLYPGSSHNAKPEEIAAMEMTRTLYRSQFQLDWLNRTHRTIFVLTGDEAFTSLVTELETCHRLALVRLAFASSDNVQYGVMDPKVTNTAVLRILAPDFESSDIKPAGTLSMYRKRSFDSRPLEYLELPAIPSKKARLSKALGDIPKIEKTQAPLSENHSALVEYIRKKRRSRREQLEAAEEVRQHQSQAQVPSSAPIEVDAAFIPMPGSVRELHTFLRNIYLDSLYTNKWLLADAMKQMYGCLEYLLDNQKENVKIPEVAAAIRSLAILSPDFDTKYNELIVGNREQELPEDERHHFAVWRGNTMRTVNSDYESRWCKALKIREGKLQILIHLLLVSLERREGILSTAHSQKELSGEVDLANPVSEYQLSIYYDRSVVWEQVYDIPGFLHDLEHTEAAGPGFRIDPSDLALSNFFTEMHKHLSSIAPDWTQFLVDRSVEEDLSESQPFGSQITSSQRSSSSFWDPPSPPEGLGNSQKSSSQKTNSQSIPGKLKGAAHEPIPLTRKKSSSRSIQDLPFMRREVDLSKRKYGADNISTSQSTKGGPMMKRASSFTKPPSTSSQKAAHNESQEEDSVQIKIRQPLSPTTPRTRYERDFGFSLAGIGLTPHRNEDLKSPDRAEEVLVENDIEGARTPRRVRRLMMETTPTHTRVDTSPTHRRPRRNLTESLLAAASEGPPGGRARKVSVIAPADNDDDGDDLDLDGLFSNIKPVTPFADIMGGDSDEEGIDLFQ